MQGMIGHHAQALDMTTLLSTRTSSEDMAPSAAFPGFKLVVDLAQQTVSTQDDTRVMRFEIDAFRKYCLLNGLDEIGLTLRQADEIRAFEARRKAQYPWYF